MSKQRILLVEDHEQVGELLTLMLHGAGHVVTWMPTAEQAQSLLVEDAAFDTLLTDARLPGMDGLQLARWARARFPAMCIALQTGYSEYRIDEFPVLYKPFGPEELLQFLAKAKAALEACLKVVVPANVP